MEKLFRKLDWFGGYATRGELEWAGVDADAITVAAWHGRRLVQVRKGHYARPSEDRDVLRAWRVGGRLTCVSALAYHVGVSDPVLHVEVPANTARLRDPDSSRRALGPDAAVVVHWTRHPGAGNRRSVTLAHAAAAASGCGVYAAGVRKMPKMPASGGRQAAAAADSVSASRIV